MTQDGKWTEMKTGNGTKSEMMEWNEFLIINFANFLYLHHRRISFFFFARVNLHNYHVGFSFFQQDSGT